MLALLFHSVLECSSQGHRHILTCRCPASLVLTNNLSIPQQLVVLTCWLVQAPGAHQGRGGALGAEARHV